MTKDEAIEIAQQYVDTSTNGINARIDGNAQWLSEWIIDAFRNQVEHPVWVVFAENLEKNRFDLNDYSIVVSTKTKQVEDVRLM
ncbi:MAG: hypothetical protein AB8B56_02255 [Crocinitomicaceae bacterium]